MGKRLTLNEIIQLESELSAVLKEDTYRGETVETSPDWYEEKDVLFESAGSPDQCTRDLALCDLTEVVQTYPECEERRLAKEILERKYNSLSLNSPEKEVYASALGLEKELKFEKARQPEETSNVLLKAGGCAVIAYAAAVYGVKLAEKIHEIIKSL